MYLPNGNLKITRQAYQETFSIYFIYVDKKLTYHLQAAKPSSESEELTAASVTFTKMIDVKNTADGGSFSQTPSVQLTLYHVCFVFVLFSGVSGTEF